MIFHDPKNPKAVAFRAELESRLTEPLPEGLAIVIGGDGFLLRTAHEHGDTFTWLGLNAGTLGFLLNDVSDWDEVVELIAAKAWRTYAFPLLESRITDVEGNIHHDKSVNDVVLERSTSQAAHIGLTIDGHTVVDLLIADGLIFSTALGSTAYGFSAGGPACHPTLSLMSVTPICPHRPRLPSFALPPGTRAVVDVLKPDRRPVRCAADGRTITGVAKVEVFYGTEVVRLAYLEGHDLTVQMIRKVVAP